MAKDHTLTVAGLDDFEAEHLSQILADYETKLLADMATAIAEGDAGMVKWLDEHSAWHKEMMTKVKWSAKEV